MGVAGDAREVGIERIESLDDAAALRVLAVAFAQHPMVPPDPPGKPEPWGRRGC